MWGSSRNSTQLSSKKQDKGGLGESFRPESFIPSIVIGFIFGMLLDLTNPTKIQPRKRVSYPESPNNRVWFRIMVTKSLKCVDLNVTESSDQMTYWLWPVLVVRQDLKMVTGKIASQCAHAATGMYSELMQSHRSLLSRWEQCGQPKIVVTCKNQQETNKIWEAANGIGLPTFVVADAGRTQVLAGSKAVLAIGPGSKASADSVTRKLRVL